MKIIQIGCGDGNDFVYDLISQNEIEFALLFDANPHVLELAKNRYKNTENIKFESLLISEKEEELSFIIPHFDAHPYSAHSSIYESHIIKHGHNMNDAKILKMKSVNINNLFLKNNIKILDYLFIDCEGEDYNIVNSIDFNNVIIKNLIFEYGHIKNDLFEKLIEKLIEIGYIIVSKIDGNITLKLKNTTTILTPKKDNFIKKFYTTSFNKTTNSKISDGWSRHNLIEYGGFKYFSEETDNLDNADFVVYIRNYECRQFCFDENIAKKIIEQNKKIIVFDYMEYGAPTVFKENYLYDYDILGFKTTGILYNQLMRDYADNGKKLIEYFVKFSELNLIHCYFKRELSNFIDLSKSQFPIYSADFMNHEYKINQYLNENEFYNKSIDLFFSWGLSSNDRPKLHGKILQNIDKFGEIVMSQKHLDKCFENNIKNLTFLYRAEWYDRIDYKKYIPHSKTMIDLYGAGMKCFRNLESALDAVSFKQDPSLLIHAYPWENGKNCIYLPNKSNNQLDIDMAYDIIHDYTKINQGKLYEIYKESKKTAELYINENYSRNYIYPKIKTI